MPRRFEIFQFLQFPRRQLLLTLLLLHCFVFGIIIIRPTCIIFDVVLVRGTNIGGRTNQRRHGLFLLLIRSLSRSSNNKLHHATIKFQTNFICLTVTFETLLGHIVGIHIVDIDLEEHGTDFTKTLFQRTIFLLLQSSSSSCTSSAFLRTSTARTQIHSCFLKVVQQLEHFELT